MSPISPTDTTQRRLLQSIVEVARSIFGAAAASIFFVDPLTGELVFQAVAGEGGEHLPGTRLPCGTGIAGWAVSSGQPVLVDDVSDSPLFARQAAESTGYVPRSIMAAPLIRDDECVGVLEVLDRDIRPRCDLGDINSLGLLATETAAVLDLLVRVRWMEGHGHPGDSTPEVPLLQRVAERLPTAPDPVRATVSMLLTTADDLLTNGSSAVGVGHA
jgi:GAF domain-containing protein